MKNIEKIKYLIILTLILSLGIVYYQLENYKKLTNSLIDQNNKISKQIEQLEQIKQTNKNLIAKKNKEIENLNDEIIKKDEEILKLTVVKETQDINFTIATPYPTKLEDLPTFKDTKEQLPNFDVVPSIKLNNENKITGFNLQYQQKF